MKVSLTEKGKFRLQMKRKSLRKKKIDFLPFVKAKKEGNLHAIF